MTGASRRHDIALAERTMQLMNRHWISLLALSVTTLLPAAVQARSWTTADAIGIEGIGDVQLSPDGTLALIAVFEPNLSKNEVGERYWLVRIADGREWPIAAQLTQPRWSPSGVRIAWLDSDKHGVPQLVVTGTRGGSLRVLTHGPRSVVAFAWSHDGGRLAAIETPPVAGRPPRMRPMTLENDYRDITPPKRDVWIVDERTAAQRRLTDDTWSYGGPETDHDPSWSAGDARIAVVRQPTPVYGDFEHQQYVTIALAGGETRQILNGPFFVYPGSVPPMFAPSGDEVAYPKSWDGKLASRNDLFIGDRDVTAPLDRDLWSCGGGGAQWAPRMLAVELLDGVSTRLFRVDPAGNAAGAHAGRRQRRAFFDCERRPDCLRLEHAGCAFRTLRPRSGKATAAHHASGSPWRLDRRHDARPALDVERSGVARATDAAARRKPRKRAARCRAARRTAVCG